MIKWFKLIKFIKKHRSKGMPAFHIITTGSEIIITTRIVTKKDEEYPHEQIRFNYK